MANSNKTSSLKEKQRAERSKLILQAAYEVLVEKGYHQASMDEIAARVGISKGALYLHFKSKEALIFMLIEEEAAKFFLLIDAISTAQIPVHERLEKILLETYKSIHGGRQILLALHSIGLNANQLRQRVDEQQSIAKLMERLAQLFDEGKSKGEFNPTIPTPIMLSVFLGLMELYSNEQIALNPLPPEELIKSVSQLFFHGLLTKA